VLYPIKLRSHSPNVLSYEIKDCFSAYSIPF
jgi:hypothetical protein